MNHDIVAVTATADPRRLHRWAAHLHESEPAPIVAVGQVYTGHWQLPSPSLLDLHTAYLGVVPAFIRGVELAYQLHPGAAAIACLHDDCLIQEPRWATQVLNYFATHSQCVLLGFGGAAQLGEDQVDGVPYRPELLVRKDFMSNMQDAEAHGRRVITPRQVAVLDGFSLIVRREYTRLLWGQLKHLRLTHHAYDAAAGAIVAQAGLEVHLLPLACHHLGGQTAVGDADYQTWARAQTPKGDQGFWEDAHARVFQAFHQLLPIVVPQPDGGAQ